MVEESKVIDEVKTEIKEFKTPALGEVCTKEMDIGRAWCLWEQFDEVVQGERTAATNSSNYGANMKQVALFNDIPSFARVWKTLPHCQIGKIFFNNKSNMVNVWKKADGSGTELRIHTLSLFQNQVEPKWEDEVNKQGGEFKMSFFAATSTVQMLWERLIFDIVAQEFPHCDFIAGVRLLDKSMSNKQGFFRLEVWTKFDDETSKLGTEMKKYLAEHFVEQILNPEEKMADRDFQKVEIMFGKHK